MKLRHIFLGLFVAFFSFSGLSEVQYLRVMFNRNGATNATIGWCQKSGINPEILLSTSDLKNDISKVDTILKPDRQVKFKSIDNHFVRLENLKPNTAYYFIIRDSEGKSNRFWFKTTPNNSNERISIIAGGDSRSRRETRVKGFKMSGKLVPHAIFFGGDYTDIDNEKKWRFWFEDWSQTYKDFDNRIIPIIAARGNHEKTDDVLVNFFDCPSEENYYDVQIGGDLINFINLNTEHVFFGFKQKNFLEQSLKDHTNFHWQIPQYHRACRPHVAWKMKMRGPKQIYRQWIELLEKYGVRFVMECDTHITKITWPMVKSKSKKSEDGFVRDDENGIVYAGEGCWGAPLRKADMKRHWTRNVGSVNSFKWIFIDKEQLVLRTIDYTNVDEVEALNDDNRFEIPNKLKVWEMDGDKVVRIESK